MRVVKYIIVIAAVLAVLGGAAGAGLFYYGKQEFEARGPANSEAVVMLDRGLGLKQIARRLENAGVITNARIFEMGVRLCGKSNDLRAGEYAIPAGASMAQIMDKFVSGEAILHKLTVAEGLSVIQVLDLVSAHEALSGEVTLAPEEGRLLPETYMFQRGMKRDELVQTMMDAKEEVLEELWETRAEGLPFDTRYEALILASIVEKETGVAEERPMVASVFVNRLRKRMRLQSDPTVIYPITKGKPLGRRILLSELKADNPYNTYVNRGLPPTPIANPGRASLEAVMNPPDTEYYYFVADGSGGHAFARTLAEHNSNVAAWRRHQRENGLR